MRPLPRLRGEGQGGGADWTVNVATPHIDKASLLLEDRTVTPAARFELSPATLIVNGWRTAPDAKLQIDGDIALNQDGRFKATGEVQLEPPTASLAIELADAPLPSVQPYVAQTTAMPIHSGKLRAKGDLSLTTSDDDSLAAAFSGDIGVADLRTTDQHVNEDLVRWRDLALTGVKFQQQPNKLRSIASSRASLMRA